MIATTLQANISRECIDIAARNLREISSLPRARIVVVGMNWRHGRDELVDADGRTVDNDGDRALVAALDDLIGRLRDTGKHVVLIGPIAEPGWDVASVLSRRLAFGRPPDRPTFLPTAEFAARFGASIHHFESRDDVGLARPDSGRVMLNGEEITDLPMYLRARSGISYLPQEASVFRKLTVEENLMAILETLPIRSRERRETMERLIDQLGLEKVRRSRGYMLSGGERRRVEIARSLVISPSFLLLDEPFSGIDPIQVLELQKIIFDLKRSGIGILVTDHNVRETLAVTDRAYIINEGTIFRSGSPEALGNDAEVRRVYLGENFNLEWQSGRWQVPAGEDS